MDKREKDRQRDNIVHLFKRAAEESDAKRTRGDSVSADIRGDHNVVAGRDVNVNKREIIRATVKPGPEHITPKQATHLQDLVKKAVEQDVTAGAVPQVAFAKWWSIVKRRYEVTTYREIPREQGEEAISWLRQQVAMNRPKLRKTDRGGWRTGHYTAIWARAKELGFSKGRVYGIVFDSLGLRVTSLKQLSDRNLKTLYNIVMSMKG